MKQNKTFRRQLMPIILILTAVPLVLLSVLSIVSLKQTLTARYKEEVEDNLQQALKIMDITLDKYETLLYETCTSGQETDDIPRHFQRLCDQEKGIVGMSLLTEEGELLFYDSLAESSKESEWLSRDIFRRQEEIVAYFMDGERIEEGGEDVYIFHISRRIKEDADENKASGTVVMTLDERVLRETIPNEQKTRTYLSDGDRIISTGDPADIGKSLTDIDKEKNYVRTVTEPKTGWKVTECYSLNLYRGTLISQVVFEVLIAFFILIILTAVGYLMSEPFVQTVEKIVKGMSDVQTGNFKVRLKEDSTVPYELNRISHGFNQMVGQIDTLIEQVKRAASEQKSAEIQALETQIDPHFLYNTLDTINWKAIEKGEMEISQLLGELADILRYTVINAGGIVSIREELYWLRQYVHLQQQRIDREVEIEEQVSNEVLDMGIHKLLLQPFVENSIKHGFRYQEGPCRIRISMELKGDILRIELEDNGKGMTPEILKKLEGPEPEGRRVGVWNVKKRLELYYSSRAFVKIDSEPGAFTRIIIELPAQKDEA